ncbi:MAG: DUF4230 domain-containing protein [Acidimicrobiia bacterium]
MAVMLREATPRQLARRRGPGLGGVVVGTVAIAVAATMVVVVGLLTGLLDIGNPFTTQTIDRTPPTVLRRLESLSSYRGASANFEVNVDLEERHRFVPTFLAGERTVFLAVGSVDAVVDFDDIDASRVVQSDGGEKVVVTLPRARTLQAVVDPDQSHVATRDRGIADRVGAVFTDSPTSEQPLYRLAAQKMNKAAGSSGVTARAERNTTKMLEALLGELGYDDVTVRYVDLDAKVGTQRETKTKTGTAA